MKHYRYTGNERLHLGTTALGQTIGGVFKVQVDRFEHPWSHGWHETPADDWKEIE